MKNETIFNYSNGNSLSHQRALHDLLVAGSTDQNRHRGEWTVVPSKLICEGDTITFRWGIDQATEARISPNVGSVVVPSGTATYTPTVTTTYTLEARNNDC